MLGGREVACYCPLVQDAAFFRRSRIRPSKTTMVPCQRGFQATGSMADMTTEKHSSITTSTLYRVTVACLLMFSLISVLTVLQERDSRFKSARAESHSNVTQNLGAISQALWNYDVDGIKAILTGLTRSGIILRAEVSDAGGAVAVIGSDDIPQNVDNVWLADLAAPNGTQKIGSLRVYESYDKVRHELIQTTTTLVVSELAKMLGLAAILFLLIYRTITRHLVTLSDQVGKLQPDDLNSNVALARHPHLPDELDALADAINLFHHQRAEERLGRQKAESEARQRLDELARLGRVAAVQSLSGSIAHELNQPLGAILNNAEAADILLANPSTDAGPIREILTDIRVEARRAGDIIASLRALIAKRSVTMSLLDLNRLMIETRDLVKWDTLMTSGSVQLDLQAELPRVRGDRVQLQQVICNLVANALEALEVRPSTTGLVRIETSRTKDGGVSVMICDNGPGIPDDQLPEIFNPFHTTKPGGTGIGLWISHMIVEQHGGKLEAKNHDDGGVCLSFSLPAALAK